MATYGASVEKERGGPNFNVGISCGNSDVEGESTGIERGRVRDLT